MEGAGPPSRILESDELFAVVQFAGNSCGVSVPVGKSPEGMPIGVQVVGRPWEDEAVLAVAAKIEEAVGEFRQPPI